MYTYPCNYHRPQKLAEALELISRLPDGKFLAGGQTLIQAMKLRLAAPTDLIDLQAIEELKGIVQDGQGLRIGAMCRHAEVSRSSLVRTHNPALASLASGIGDRQVRHQGTIGGSVANNDPAADYPSAIMALGATVITNRRSIQADDFFVDMYTTALEEGELILAFSIPDPIRAGYAKFPSPASGFALTGVFVAEFPGYVRVAATGAGSHVFRIPEMEQALTAAFRTASLDPISLNPEAFQLSEDLHASAAYRSRLCTIMAKRAVEYALEHGMQK